jgi:methyl-accepting chemotaxis protein
MIDAVQHSAHAAVIAMGESVSEVGSGVTLANRAGATIVQIKEGAGHVVDVVNGISAALAQQCSANDSLSQQVETVARITQENSHAAAETALEADSLKSLAGDLQAAVGRFKI